MSKKVFTIFIFLIMIMGTILTLVSISYSNNSIEKFPIKLEKEEKSNKIIDTNKEKIILEISEKLIRSRENVISLSFFYDTDNNVKILIKASEMILEEANKASMTDNNIDVCKRDKILAISYNVIESDPNIMFFHAGFITTYVNDENIKLLIEISKKILEQAEKVSAQ